MSCKLLEELARLEEEYSLPAVAAKAQIAALRTVGDPQRRFEIRWQITRALYEHGFSAEEVRNAYRLLSWMMRLPREMQLTFRRKVIEYEGREKMPYITDIEELAIERGIQQGIQQGIERGVERGQLLQTTRLTLSHCPNWNGVSVTRCPDSGLRWRRCLWRKPSSLPWTCWTSG